MSLGGSSIGVRVGEGVDGWGKSCEVGCLLGAKGTLVRLVVGWGGGGKWSRGSLAIVWWEIGFLVGGFMGVGNSGREAHGEKDSGGGVESGGLG